MERENATGDADDSRVGAESPDQDSTAIPIETPATATIAATGPMSNAADANGDRPNALTIIGQGTPSSFELTVDGEIELADEDGEANVTILSGTTVEGTIETGTVTFRFTGDLTDVTFVDRGITGHKPATTPNVHVDYAAPER
ncbi:hypothetical protein HYG81_05305 [Natrinema zhouii]|uniref:Uncharacterized protein n=1 Tax=Natrinema zhouii TaxID=1710539 RepID=A0A7D6H7W2_9EURY|nr:hypothetical protein [Natrinema zhouii]QLK27028.1 hypothetical protein HYG81_05305 [Natrinema zhouii]